MGSTKQERELLREISNSVGFFFLMFFVFLGKKKETVSGPLVQRTAISKKKRATFNVTEVTLVLESLPFIYFTLCHLLPNST